MSQVFATKSPTGEKDLPPIEPTEDVKPVVAAARVAQEKWAKEDLATRARVVSKMKRVILQKAESIAQIVADETGKPEVEALLGEVLPSGDVVDYWFMNAEEFLEPIDIEIDRLAYPAKSGWILREPRGV